MIITVVAVLVLVKFHKGFVDVATPTGILVAIVEFGSSIPSQKVLKAGNGAHSLRLVACVGDGQRENGAG